jgi:Ran GTPase-activating protein (RanGAP) involved in mRNA processing and transport
MSVVVTSRPSASAPLHELPDIDRFVEVCGFSKEHIAEYIQSEFTSDQGKADRLREQLEYNPLVESVCSVPLNCAIVCHLWRTLEEALPTTMTELYKKIILNVILRNMKKKDEFKHISSLTNFNILPKELQQSWELLCKFAYETIARDQIVFSEQELADIFPCSLENILCFGLLQTANTILEMGYGRSFHFLHLTFQEYLAALYMVKQISESGPFPEQFMSILDLGSNPSHYDILCRFICGIYFNDMEFICFTDIQPFIPKFRRIPCLCAFEAKSKYLCTELLDGIHTGYPFCPTHSSYDCAAMLYAINYINNIRQSGKLKFNMYLYFGNSGVIIREAQIRELADILAKKDGMLQIQVLELNCNELTDKSISDLFQRASSSFRSLYRLNLEGNKIGSHSIALLGKSTTNKLRRLLLSDCSLGVSGMQALEDAVSGGSLRALEHLNLAGSLTSDADVNGALLATSLNTIMSCNFGLEHLDLSRNNLGIPGASALSRILGDRYKITSSLQELGLSPAIDINLNETNLGDKGLILLAECSGHINMHRLYLNGNDIHATGVSYLADGIDSGRIVVQEDLSLASNPLGLEGIGEVGRILSSIHCQLREVILSRCHLGTTSSSANISASAVHINQQKVCHALQNNTIEKLGLEGNNFTGDGIHNLFGVLQLFPCLKMLWTDQCGITSDDLKLLLEYFKDSNILRGLEYWDLGMNEIDDEGAVAFVDHLPSLFPNLGCGNFSIGIYFSGNFAFFEHHTNSVINRKLHSLIEVPAAHTIRTLHGVNAYFFYYAL